MMILEIPTPLPIRQGQTGENVRHVQELLCINDISVRCDSSFGPATEFAVRMFQERTGCHVDGVVGEETVRALTYPLREATKGIDAAGMTLGEVVVEYAEQHFAQRPQEVRGENCGPWVRLYMNGNESKKWKWCAGFVSFILKQACNSAKIKPPFRGSFSCDQLVANAKRAGYFLSEADVRAGAKVEPGAIFLKRVSETDWVHCGIVVDSGESAFMAIEGNASPNPTGDREGHGYCVCRKIRSYLGKDFIKMR